MRKKDLNIEIGELYQISPSARVTSFYVRLPVTKDQYLHNYDIIKYPEIYDKVTRMWLTNSGKYFSSEKIIVVPKEIVWLKFSTSKIKSIDENLYHPLIEVYEMKQNHKFFVKPQAIEKLLDGNDHNQDMEIKLKNYKKTLLANLRNRK